MKLIYTVSLLVFVFGVSAQSPSLRLNPNIVLPKDSIESKRLIQSLNDFLNAAQKPNEDNPYVYEPEKIETFIVLDEINGITKSGKFKDDEFYKPYLTNIVLLKEGSYWIQVSYIGISENAAYPRATFELMAHRSNNSFVFSSTLLKNAQYWKVIKEGNMVFHYQHTINKARIKAFTTLTAEFDRKLKLTNKTADYYCCDNIIELKKLVGVVYKSDYNGRAESVWSSSLGNRSLVVLGNDNAGFDHFDPHDLFHDRLSLVISRNKVNKPVDEGCAYLYGGSWGLTWKEILKAFREQVASNKNTNWMEIKETPVYFKTKEFNNSADYIVNALLVQKIEKEKGFSGVWELLNVGPFEKDNVKYYNTLEKLTGITKETYNQKIWELIDKEK